MPVENKLKDGGHIILSCSNCEAKLVDIWITQADAPFEWTAKALCCFCGDESFIKKFKGRFAHCGFGKELSDDDFKYKTKISKIDSSGNHMIIFETEKANK